MPFALFQGDCVQIRGHVENCPQSHLPMTAFSSACPLPAQQHNRAWPGNWDRLRATSAQGIRVTEEWWHTDREELQLSSHVDVPVPPLCSPRGRQQEAGKQQRNSSIWGAAQLPPVGQESPSQRKTTQGQKHSQILAKSHYWAD